MVDEGADLLDVGGESTRPGHEAVSTPRRDRTGSCRSSRALRAALPDTPLSVDTTKAAVAAAAARRRRGPRQRRLGRRARRRPRSGSRPTRGVPIVLMHNRAEAALHEPDGRDRRRPPAGDRAGARGRRRVGRDHRRSRASGSARRPTHNLVLLRELATLRVLGRPILLGTSRKSTLGKVLDLPPDSGSRRRSRRPRSAIAAGVDIVRVHDVRPNVRAARMADAIVRGGPTPAPRRRP